MHVPERLGPFPIVRLLGQGGMGVVYEAVDPQLGRHVALKLLRRDALDGPSHDRFLREAEVLARLTHPGVVRVHRAGELPQGPFLLQELVEGRSLRDALEAGPFEARRAALLARALADALEAVHRAGALHRDLKPDNVLLRPTGEPVLIDFGVALDQDAETLTRTGALVGTIAYMAPEQVRASGGARLDARVDVYALGCLLFELLAGRPVYAGGPFEVMAKILQGEQPALTDVAPAVPPELAAVVTVALAPDRERRLASAAVLREELDLFLSGQSTSSGIVVAAQARRRRARRAAATGTLLALGGLAGAGWVATRPPEAAGPADLPAAGAARDAALEQAAAALAAGDAAKAEALLVVPGPDTEGRAALAARVAGARAVELAAAGEPLPALARLRALRARDPAAADAGLAAAAAALLGRAAPAQTPSPEDPRAARRAQGTDDLLEQAAAGLEQLASAWPGARLPAEAAAPLAASASAGTHAWPVAREAARLLRHDPPRAIPWARRALEGAPGPAVDAALRPALREQLARLLDATGAPAAAREAARLRAPGN